MTETNLRIVAGGVDVQMTVRVLKVSGQDLTPNVLNKACDRLRKKRGLAAVPLPAQNEILVATGSPVRPLKIEKSDWFLEAEDSGETRLLCFRNPADRHLLAVLFERGAMSRLERETGRWVIKGFPRSFYDRRPFQTAAHIDAYRHYRVSSEIVDDVGIGLAVDVHTAFFTRDTLGEFFRDDIPREQQERLQRRFHQLRNSRNGRKGTLMYNNGRTNTICYYDSFPRGITAGTIGKFKAENIWYSSLTDYYRKKHGVLVRDGDSVVKVSFKRSSTDDSSNGLGKPVFVCAKMVRLRVPNDRRPKELKQADKITAMRREKLTTRLWQSLNHEPLGAGFPKVEEEFWRPTSEKTFIVTPPTPVFGDGAEQDPPVSATISEYRAYYRDRLSLLDEYGCYHVPATVDRVLHVAAPRDLSDVIVSVFGDAVTHSLSRWTRKTIQWNPVRYSSLDDAFTALNRSDDRGLCVFIFDSQDCEEDTPETYYLVSHELKQWRVKRVTVRTLLEKAAGIAGTATNSQPNSFRNWVSFVEMSALDILQQMNCVPWSVKHGLYYPAHLAIDVGEGRKHFGVSLFICQPNSGTPNFFFRSVVWDKPDADREEINARLLEKAILEVCRIAVDKHSRFTPLPSVLVLRDGRECGGELPTIMGVRKDLVEMGFLNEVGLIAPVDVHKRSAKGLRLWDRAREARLRNTLEGRGVFLDPETVIINNTGAATLTQGTAEPVVLQARSESVEIMKAAIDFHQTCRLNYSNPAKAQKLAFVMKRLDDELKGRAAEVSGHFK